MKTTRIPLLVILGPTASGKTSLGLEVAEAVDGEIISADAFAAYRGLDIGTDKPTAEARERVHHHLIDILDPSEVYSAGAFAKAAHSAIDEIVRRKRTPVVVGGTHFYIRALLLGLFPSPPRNPEIGGRLAAEWALDPTRLFGRLEHIDPESARRIGVNDRQRILRALEVWEATGETLTSHWKQQQTQSIYDPLLVAPQRSRDDLYARINARVDGMFASGLVEEVAAILASGVPGEAHALKAIGYRDTVALLDGRCDLPTTVENIRKSSRRFAKRQLTWLRDVREGTVHWVPPIEEGGAAAVIHLWDTHTKERRAT
jgi:tRNA dimethylallyltransferase